METIDGLPKIIDRDCTADHGHRRTRILATATQEFSHSAVINDAQHSLTPQSAARQLNACSTPHAGRLLAQKKRRKMLWNI